MSEVDWKRNAVFCLFGGAYLGLFQYWYQINIFKRLFPASVERFTALPIKEKLTDVPGLKALAGQTVLDVSMLSFVYLPTFYSFKAGVFDTQGVGPVGWVKTGTGQWITNFSSDAVKIVQFWTPVDIICFSIPLYLRYVPVLPPIKKSHERVVAIYQGSFLVSPSPPDHTGFRSGTSSRSCGPPTCR